MTDERGAVTLTYDAELVRMVRGGPTAANMTAPAEDVADEILECDDDLAVSLFIDDADECPSPMMIVSPPAFPQTMCISSQWWCGNT